MKAFVLSDIHLRLENLKKLCEKAKNEHVELIVVCGDLSNFGGNIAPVLEELSFAQVIAIPGNLDTLDVLKELEEKGISIHKNKKKISSYTFVGFGGGKLGDPGNFSSNEEDIFDSLKELLQGEKNVFLVTHLPPFNTSIDLTHSGIHIGSESVRKIIKEFQPKANFCGHAHEAFGQCNIGETVCVNVASVKEGKAAIVELEELEVKWLELK